MRIISDFKDYYDFVAGHDTDPRKVYIRKSIIVGDENYKKYVTEENKEMLTRLPHHMRIMLKVGGISGRYLMKILYLCNKVYPYIIDTDTNNVYFKYDELPSHLIDNYIPDIDRHNIFGLSPVYYNWSRRRVKRDFFEEIFSAEVSTEINTHLASPIYMGRRRGLVDEAVINGSLGDIGFSSLMSPSQVFTTIYNWLPYDEPLPNVDPTDMLRFESKGFDKKTSFRK